jgi:hypothetical protein
MTRRHQEGKKMKRFNDTCECLEAIAVIHPDPALREALVHALISLGHNCVGHGSAEELETNPVKIGAVILDSDALNRGDGGTLEKVRQKAGPVPVIINDQIFDSSGRGALAALFDQLKRLTHSIRLFHKCRESET